MEEAFNSLVSNVNALAQSLTYYVYEMDEHDEDAYYSREENFEDVDYNARGQDCHYIPLLEDEIDNHYISNYQGVNYFDDPSSSMNFYSRQDDKEQEVSSLAQLITQMIATQLQQGNDIKLIMTELEQGREALKSLKTQFAQLESRLSQNLEKFHLQPDARLEEEVEEQKTPYVAPPAYVPPMHYSHRQFEVPVEIIDENNVIDVCQLTIVEGKVLSDECAKYSDIVENSLIELVKKSFHEGPEIRICNTRLKEIVGVLARTLI